jgi:hypothetical protein
MAYTHTITWLSRPTVVLYAGSDGSPSSRGSLGTTRRLVMPQSIRTRMHCLSVYLSNIEFMNCVKYSGVGGLQLPITIVLINALHAAQSIATISSLQLTENC